MTPEKPIEEKLKECERKFLNALQEYPLPLTLTSAIDHRYIEVNQTFERISGWKRDEIIGKTPFDINIWIDPSQRLNYVKRLLSDGTVKDFYVRARLRNRDVWLGLGFGALIEINEEPCILSLIAGVADFRPEEARQDEIALASMAHTLIREQDQERATVARELRERVERLILVGLNLDRVEQESEPERSQLITEAKRQIEKLVMDMQDLAQRLHSSKLEYLGLAVAAAELCKELSEKMKIEIQFASQGVPKKMAPHVSLCLYRVLQGVLETMLTHSGPQSIQVLLSGGPNEVHLTVRDSGVGLEVGEATNASRIGLMILRERVALVGGDFSVQSQGGRRTTIEAHVPLGAQN